MIHLCLVKQIKVVRLLLDTVNTAAEVPPPEIYHFVTS